MPRRPRPGPLRPCALGQVRLGPGPVREAFDVNRRHLASLDPERLLHMFRMTAGLPSSAAPLGGWEAPDNELRGHFVGHYLSAAAFAWAAAEDRTMRERTAYLVRELARCQAAHGDG